MLHEIQHVKSGTDYDHYLGNDALFDIDCPVCSIQAYATNYRHNSGSKSTLNKVRMPSNKRFSLSDSIIDIWDRLDDQTKSIILDYVTPTYPNYLSRPSFSKTPLSHHSTGNSGFANSSPGTQTHPHEISAYDFLLANMHALDYGKDVEDPPN
jgi:hypothetical protein